MWRKGNLDIQSGNSEACKPGREFSPLTLSTGLPDSRIVRNAFLWFKPLSLPYIYCFVGPSWLRLLKPKLTSSSILYDLQVCSCISMRAISWLPYLNFYKWHFPFLVLFSVSLISSHTNTKKKKKRKKKPETKLFWGNNSTKIKEIFRHDIKF